MAFRDFLDDEVMRPRILLGGMLLVFVLLLVALWRIQVAHGQSYQQDLMRQSVRRVRIPGIRGKILDRHSVCLADNRPSYCIAVYLEDLRRPGKWSRTIDVVEKQLDEIAAIIGKPRQIGREDIQVHIRKRLPLPLVAWRDIDEVSLARLVEQESLLPGVDILVEPVRVYPRKGSACHVLGYVGRADAPREEDEEPYHYYLPEMAGRSGIEKRFDEWLRGEPGGKLVRVDVSGFRHDDLAVREPRDGRTVRLSLDARIQELSEKALEGRNGAIVVVDPSNGDVLAMASAPGFDPNQFIPAISSEVWAGITNNPATPLVNRALSGAFPPGSIFKMVVALAAMQNGAAGPKTAFSCPGHFDLGRARFRCWYTPGHGLLDMRQAIQRSCNVYFFRLGLLTGYEAIYHMAAAMGFGKPTGISLDSEASGLLPDDGWKRLVHGDGWRDGDTCNISIGQGFLMVTPLQMALATAAVANGGKLFKPRLVLDVQEEGGAGFARMAPEVSNVLRWPAESLTLVRAGMRDVVESDEGTGRLARIPGARAAGKTGTAEIGRKHSGKKLGWMIAFAPYENPKYAIALMVEDALTGGTTAAPIMRQLLLGLFPDTRPIRGAG